MEPEREAGDAPVSLVVLDITGMLARLTGITGWTEFQGPSSRCGLDYWFNGSAPAGDEDEAEAGEDRAAPVALEAYVNVDQSRLLLSVCPKDEAHEDPEGTYRWRVEADLADPEDPYAALVSEAVGTGSDG